MKYLIAFLIVFLCACSEEKHSSQQGAKDVGATVTASARQSVPIPVNAGHNTPTLSAAEMLAAFHKDIEICKSVVKLLKEDRSFVDIDYSTPQPEPIDVLSRQAKYANTETFKHILSNRKYFIVGLANMEVGNPWAEAWADNDEHIFCQLTPQRMYEIELLGESQEAWEIRQYFLSKMLYGLSPITSLTVDSAEEFEGLKTLIQEAARRYAHELRPKFIAWVKQATKVVEKERNKIKPDGVFSVEEQTRILNGRLAFLRSFVAR